MNISFVFIRINAWTEWYFSDSFQYDRIFNTALLFVSVHRVVTRMEFASNEIPSAKDNAKNIYDGFSLGNFTIMMQMMRWILKIKTILKMMTLINIMEFTIKIV